MFVAEKKDEKYSEKWFSSLEGINMPVIQGLCFFGKLEEGSVLLPSSSHA
jgi:hypothetical protein